MPDVKITKSEQKILNLLGDGHPHRPDEIKRVLNDDMMEPATVQIHISNLRKKLRILGQDVITVEMERRAGICLYRLVRLSASHIRP